MELERHDIQAGEGDASGSSRASSRRLGLNDMGGQIFSGIHNADHSRSHFGNVYNNVYPNHDQPKSDVEKARDLMDALIFKGMGDRLMTVSPACADTCNWILRTLEYSSWRNSAHRRSNNGVLWIKGKAGTGKSTLMRYIHDHARKSFQEETTISFFFNARSVDNISKSTEGMYRSLVYQLYDRMPHLKMAAIQRIQVAEQQSWSVEVLEDLFREAVLSLASHEKVTCYIDALDECEISQVLLAVEHFDTLSQSAILAGVNFCLCFASRHYPHIVMQLHEEVRLDTLPEHLQDITIYLTNRFTIQSPVRAELQAEIEERCSGVFLWVVLVVRMLKYEYSRGATIPQLRKTLRIVPEQLDALFASMSDSAGEAFHVAMRWVLFTKRPLQPEELYFIIKLSMGQLTSTHWDRQEVDMTTINMFILHISQGLIECTTGSLRRLQFIHESVREYLLCGHLSSLEDVSQEQQVAASHWEMAKVCREYLDLYLQVSSVSESQKYDLRLPQRRPFLEHSVTYLLDYSDVACKGGVVDLTSLHDFPLREFIALAGSFCYEGGGSYSGVHHDHTAALLMLLIETGCYASAEVMLKDAACSDLDTEDDTETSSTPAPPLALTTLDLGTCCGGLLGSPLHAAVRTGKKDLVQLLLSYGADVNLSGELPFRGYLRAYQTPLVLVMGFTTTDMAQFLLDHGAIVNSFSPEGGMTALHQIGMTALHQGDMTALHRACQGPNPQEPTPVVAALVGETQSARAGSALDFYGQDSSIRESERLLLVWILQKVDLLLRRGADVNLPTRHCPLTSRSGMTALHIVISSGNPHAVCLAVIRTLLAAGADVNAADGKGRTVLHHLILSVEGHASWHAACIIRTLLDAGANINAVDAEGRTVLHMLPLNGTGCINTLLNAGADLNAADAEDRTALIVAASIGSVQVVGELLEHQDLNVEYRSSTVGTALEAAQRCGHREVCSLLRTRSAGSVVIWGGDTTSYRTLSAKKQEELRPRPRLSPGPTTLRTLHPLSFPTPDG